MDQPSVQNTPQEFEHQWFAISEEISQQVAELPEVVAMSERVKSGQVLDLDSRSKFIAAVNKVKDDILHEKFGKEGSPQWMEFVERWRAWFNSKSEPSARAGGRELTGAEHIAYSSTPDPEAFLKSMVK